MSTLRLPLPRYQGFGQRSPSARAPRSRGTSPAAARGSERRAGRTPAPPAPPRLPARPPRLPGSRGRGNPALGSASRVLRAADKPGSPCPAGTCRPGMGDRLPGQALPAGEDFGLTKWQYSSTDFMEKRVVCVFLKKKKRKHQKNTRTKPLGCRELTTKAAGEAGRRGGWFWLREMLRWCL